MPFSSYGKILDLNVPIFQLLAERGMTISWCGVVTRSREQVSRSSMGGQNLGRPQL